MKKIVSTTLLILSILAINFHHLRAQNWFPLEVGNSWQYLSCAGYSSFPGGSSQHYSLDIHSIISDTTINLNKYFKWTRFPNALLRFDTTEQKLYQYCDSVESVIMDFNLSVDSIAYCSDYSCSESACLIIEDNMDFGDSTIYLKGYYRFIYGVTSYNFYEYFSIDLGPAKNYYTGESHGGLFSSYSYSLLQAKINNINYSYTYNPEIVIVPLTVLSDSIFNLIFDVNHHYNRVFPNPTPNTSLNFIDTVKMYSFYTKDDEIVENPVIYAQSLSGTASWRINNVLNLDLMKDDYKFKYRIEAIDKGLLPHRSFAPDTGYFEVVFDSTTSVNDFTENSLTLALHQNYPNPFNPSTVISYQLPTAGDITLKVYDVLGREVAILVDEYKEAGYHKVEFLPESPIGAGSIKNPASGVYFYKLKAGGYVETKKMVLLR